MKLNKKTDIAIQALLYLRNNNYINENYFSAHQLSAELNISYNNLRKIFRTLNEMGFIHSKLGQNGGVALTTNYNQLSIKQLLIEFEDFKHEQQRINCEICNITPSCSFVHITRTALINFFNTFEHVTLDDL